MKVSGDPYKTLGLSHDASALEIKRAYRTLARKYHPDKWVQQNNATQQDIATTQFAKIADAYALLSDPQRKAQYDHIYKYGGFDHPDDGDDERISSPQQHSATTTTTTSSTTTTTTTRRKRKNYERGIGYTCYDPLAFLWTHGQIHARRTVAGIHIPSRFHNNPSASFRFAFSSGEVWTSPTGTKKCVSQTTQFANGKKETVKETVIYHPDGRKEVVIEGDDVTPQRYYSTHNNISKQPQTELPWYIHAWQEIREKLSMCHNPCAVTQ